MTNKTYHLGFDLFTPDVGTIEEMTCPCCSAKMDVERNVKRAIRWVGEDRGRCDSFTCPNTGEKWHNQIIALRELKDRTPSQSLAQLCQGEIDVILKTKSPTKDTWKTL